MSRKFTNIHGLPDGIVRAVTNDPYTKGNADYSITGLLKPPRISVLERKHRDEIEEDVSERIWSLLGQATHTILERAETEAIPEDRWFLELDGKRISGGLDRFDIYQGKIADYKVTSIYKVRDGVPPEYEQQLNCYAGIIRAAGYPVFELEIVAILRDWLKRESKRNPAYPPTQIKVLSVPVWPQEKVLAFLRGRINLHEAAKSLLPECTREERWATNDVWAVMKDGRKTAVRLHDSEKFAQDHATALGKGHSVVFRPGENKRCQDYCSAAKFCDQYQSMKKPTESVEEIA